MVIPDGISFEDAVFLPSVETGVIAALVVSALTRSYSPPFAAVSMVHDAAPRLGERLAVLGQGIIGLLVRPESRCLPFCCALSDFCALWAVLCCVADTSMHCTCCCSPTRSDHGDSVPRLLCGLHCH